MDCAQGKVLCLTRSSIIVSMRLLVGTLVWCDW